MADLFKKLETLLRSQINDTLPTIPRLKRSADERALDDQISSLRQRINEAIDHENILQAKQERLLAELSQLDKQADDAIKNGDDAAARHYLIQRERAEQRLKMAEADLEAHRLSAQQLIQSVNAMEAAVADSQQSTAGAEPTNVPEPVTEEADAEVSGIVDLVQRTREQLDAQGKKASTNKPPVETLATPDPSGTDTDDTDDLDNRRQRLSRR